MRQQTVWTLWHQMVLEATLLPLCLLLLCGVSGMLELWYSRGRLGITQQQWQLTGPCGAGTQPPDAPDARQPGLPENPTSTVLHTSNSRGSQQVRLRAEALHEKESRESDQTEAACPGHLAPPGTATPLNEPSSLGGEGPPAADSPLLNVTAQERAAAVASMLQKLLGAAPSAEPAELLAMLQSLLEPC